MPHLIDSDYINRANRYANLAKMLERAYRFVQSVKSTFIDCQLNHLYLQRYVDRFNYLDNKIRDAKAKTAEWDPSKSNISSK